MVPLNSETLWISEANDVINEISVKLPSLFLISKVSSFLDKNFVQLSMNNIIEAENFEPEAIFENAINKIKDNHLKDITSIAMSLSDIASNKHYSSSEHEKSNIIP